MRRLAGWMGGLTAALLATLPVAAGSLTASCAPSLRMVHRSRAYFERCYAADFDPQIPRTERHACWVAWLDHYTSGQPRERIMYARTRMIAQGAATDPLLLPGVGDDAIVARSAHGTPTALAIDARDLTSIAPADSIADARSASLTTHDADAGVAHDAGYAASSDAAVEDASLRTDASSDAGLSDGAPRARERLAIPPPPPPAVPHRGSRACSPICDPRFIACVERCDPAAPEPCRDACTAEHRACGNACL